MFKSYLIPVSVVLTTLQYFLFLNNNIFIDFLETLVKYRSCQKPSRKVLRMGFFSFNFPNPKNWL